LTQSGKSAEAKPAKAASPNMKMIFITSQYIFENALEIIPLKTGKISGRTKVYQVFKLSTHSMRGVAAPHPAFILPSYILTSVSLC
jgi:hypothetical protein